MKTQAELFEKYRKMIGKKVMKNGIPDAKIKPFKSGSKVNTVTGVVIHEILNTPAFTFAEDTSIVECRRCRLVEEGDI